MKFNELIRSKGFTVQSLAATANVSPRSLEQYSSGRIKWSGARAKMIIPVSEVLGIHPKELLNLDED